MAKGYTQAKGLDYHETFALVAKIVTVRCLLAIVAAKQWTISQFDVNNAFLHGDLDEEVYMKIPLRFSRQGEQQVCGLNKSLYGLKQASRNWFSKFSNAFIAAGFSQSKAEYSLFTKITRMSSTYVLIYVDDILVIGIDPQAILSSKGFLETQFHLKDLGTLKYFLGIEVARSSKGLLLCQRKYTLDILDDAGLLGCCTSDFPMEQHLKLHTNDGEALEGPTQYRRLIGRLIYLTITRPDILYPIHILSQFMQTPRRPHIDVALWLLCYLKGSLG